MSKDTKKPARKKGAMKRLLAYALKKHRVMFAVIIITVIFSSMASISSSIALKYIVDDIITPALHAGGMSAVWDKFISFVVTMGCVYFVGVAASAAQAQLLNLMTQQIMTDLRCDLFAHMQKLPIKYFDTNNHGDIMSIYTNDIETVRQLIAQSLPQVLMSGIMIVMLIVVMLSDRKSVV